MLARIIRRCRPDHSFVAAWSFVGLINDDKSVRADPPWWLRIVDANFLKRWMSALHPHELIHRQHIVVEISHDPQRSSDHQEHDQHAEGEREHIVGIVGARGDVQEEHQMHAHLRDRQHDDSDGYARLPDEVSAGDEKRRGREKNGKTQTYDISEQFRTYAGFILVAGRDIEVALDSLDLIAHTALPSR